MICGNKFMIKFSRFQKFSVISILSLKKFRSEIDHNKKFVFLNKNYKLNFFILNHFINSKGYLRFKKLFSFIFLILKRKVKLLKFIKKFLRRLNRPFVLSYFGYYLGFISDINFKSWINSIRGNLIFNLSKKKLKVSNYNLTKLKHLDGKVNYEISLLRNARVDLSKFKNLDPRFIKTSQFPRTWFIYLRRTYSNFMLTLTDFWGGVIACYTSGSSGIKGRKKYKISPKAVEHISKKFIPYFLKLGIKKINIVTYRMRAPGLSILVNSLLSFGLSITSFNVRILRAHNGVRKCKGR